MLYFVYGVLVKICVKEMEIKALDLSFFRSLCMFVGSAILVLSMRVSLHIERKDRWTLVLRSILGISANILSVYGLSMVSLTVMMAITNTKPIWASILGYLFLSEGMSALEIVALIFSFTSVLCIAFSKSDITDAVVEEENKL